MSVSNITDGRRPPLGRRFEKGNPGKQPGAKPISERRARKLVAQAVLADVGGEHVADFDGDALGYLQAVYTGKRVGDPLRLAAATQALKFERPSLSAIAVATSPQLPSTRAETKARILQLLEGSDLVTIEHAGTDGGPRTSDDSGAGGASSAS